MRPLKVAPSWWFLQETEHKKEYENRGKGNVEEKIGKRNRGRVINARATPTCEEFT